MVLKMVKAKFRIIVILGCKEEDAFWHGYREDNHFICDILLFKLVSNYLCIYYIFILIHKYALNILLNILLKIIVPNILCTYWWLHKPHPATLSFYNPEPLAFMCFQSRGFDTSVSPRRISNNFPKKKIQKTFQKKSRKPKVTEKKPNTFTTIYPVGVCTQTTWYIPIS